MFFLMQIKRQKKGKNISGNVRLKPILKILDDIMF